MRPIRIKISDPDLNLTWKKSLMMADSHTIDKIGVLFEKLLQEMISNARKEKAKATKK